MITANTRVTGKLDPKLVAKGLDRYHKDGCIWVQRHPELNNMFLIANQFICVCVPDHPKLYFYTSFPKDWKSAEFEPSSNEPVPHHRPPYSYWKNWTSEDIATVEPTRYLYESSGSTLCRIFQDEAGNETLINKQFCDMLASDFGDLDEFLFEQSAPNEPMRVASANGYCMVIMPMVKREG